MAAGGHGCQGAWLPGACVAAGGSMRGCRGGMHGCRGACVAAKGCAWMLGGHA